MMCVANSATSILGITVPICGEVLYTKCVEREYMCRKRTQNSHRSYLVEPGVPLVGRCRGWVLLLLSNCDATRVAVLVYEPAR